MNEPCKCKEDGSGCLWFMALLVWAAIGYAIYADFKDLQKRVEDLEQLMEPTK